MPLPALMYYASNVCQTFSTYTSNLHPRLSTEKSNYWIDACCINQDYQDSFCNASQDEFKNQIQLLEKSDYQFKSTLEKKILSIKICYCWNTTIFKQTNNIHTNIKIPSWSKINLPPPPPKKKKNYSHTHYIPSSIPTQLSYNV